MSERKSTIFIKEGLPEHFPTMMMPVSFWEQLGRTVATFGFLEEVLAKAIFAFTGTMPIDPEEAEVEFAKWVEKLERALSDQLNSLINTYERAVRAHPNATITNIEDLTSDLRRVATIRNVLCHGSWHFPNPSGQATPFFVNRKMEKWETPINEAYLKALRESVVGMALGVMNTVTHMGWQFPGASNPGEVIWKGR